MNFNLDPTKQAQELIFSLKVRMINHPPLFFNQNLVPQTSLQKHLGMYSNSKVNFSEHLKSIFQKTNKTMRLLRNLRILLLRAPLITIYKSFIRPHLDYGNIIYDQTFDILFQQKMESIQYSPALAITGAKRRSFREELLALLNTVTILTCPVYNSKVSRNLLAFYFSATLLSAIRKCFYPQCYYRLHHFDRKIRKI